MVVAQLVSAPAGSGSRSSGGRAGGTRQGLRGYSTRVRSTDFTRFAGGLKGRFAELAGGGVLYRYIVYRLVYRLSIRSRSTSRDAHTYRGS